MESHSIKIIKWGLIFLSKPGRMLFDAETFEIADAHGEAVIIGAPSDINSVNYNSINGMVTVKMNDESKVNFVLTDSAGTAAFGAYLEEHHIREFSV